MKLGVFSDQDIIDLINNSNIISNTKIDDSQVQPSSLDLTIGKKIYHMPFSSIPDRDIGEYLKSKSNYEVDLTKNRFLHKGNIYVAELNESLNLPDNICARSNPKSSIGRIDVHVRLITENGNYFDEIPPGYKGKLYLEIYPNSFDLIVPANTSFNQIRLFDVGARELDLGTLNYLAKYETILTRDNIKIDPEQYVENDSVYVTIDLSEEVPGYVSRQDAPPIDLSKRDLPLSKYFNKINLYENGIIIQKDSFYLFKTKEKIYTPVTHCAEMSDISTKSGEFRAHYAGFFDPGFGAETVLEVRNSGAPHYIKDGQRIAGIKFFELRSKPNKTYGSQIGSSYQNQTGVKPAKFFDINN